MKVSFQGIGQWCATFLGGVAEGHVVKVDGGGCAAECADGEPFCGAAVYAGEDACTVQMGGFVTVGYSGAAPALGYTALAADGLGGVRSAGEAEDGVRRWVVDRDEVGKTVTILL